MALTTENKIGIAVIVVLFIVVIVIVFLMPSKTGPPTGACCSKDYCATNPQTYDQCMDLKTELKTQEQPCWHIAADLNNYLDIDNLEGPDGKITYDAKDMKQVAKPNGKDPVANCSEKP